MSYKIGYYSYYEKPWRGLARKMWEHHDSIFELVRKKHDIEIHPIFHPGSQKKLDQYNSGDTSIVVRGYQNIPLIFHDFDNYTDFDALFLEVGRFCRFDEAYGSIEEDEVIKSRQYVLYIIEECKKKHVPILWYDGDADLINPNHKGFAEYLRIESKIDEYDLVTFVGTYEEGLNPKHNLKNFKFVPYNINFDRLTETISPRSSNTPYLSTYFGSNFRRDNFGEIFMKLAQYGKVRVYGSSWRKYIARDKDHLIEWNKGLWLECEEFKKYFDDSLIGIYGTAKSHYKMKHYTLRIVEYLQAGIYIVPDNVEYLVEKFPEGQFTVADLDNFDKTIEFIGTLIHNYEDMVLAQRDKLRETIDSKNYVHVYEEALGLK